MENKDWIKDYRKSIEWCWYKDIPTAHLFFHLLRVANWKTGYIGSLQILPGERVTSSIKLAEETGLSRQQVRTALEKLVSTNEITIISTKQFTHIKVQNWDKYQQEITNTSTNEQPTSNQRVTTIEEGNKGRRKETDSGDFDSFWNMYPRKEGKAKAKTAYNKVTKEHYAIIQGLEKYILFWRHEKIETRYIVHPATFLNGRRWEDDIPINKQSMNQSYSPYDV